MTSLLRQHKRLLGAWIFLLGALLAAHVYYVYPLKKRADDLAGKIDTRAREMHAAGWGASPERLKRLLDRQEKKLSQLDRRMNQVWTRVERTFEDEMRRFDGDMNQLVTRVSRLDFAEAYSKTIYDLEASGKWTFAPEVLGLSENKVSKTIYEMLMQLWVLEKVIRLADEHGLAPVDDIVSVPRRSADGSPAADPQTGNPEYEARQISQVTCLPVRANYLSGDNDQPFFLEIPVELKATCSPSQLQAFMTALADPGGKNFLAMDRLEIYSPPSKSARPTSSLRVAARIVAFARLPWPAGEERGSGTDSSESTAGGAGP